MLPLSTPIASLKMVGPAFSLRLKKLAIETIGDLLYHIPFRYEDFSIVSKINLLQAGEKVTIAGEIASIGNVFTRQGKKIQKAV
ncbi:DNA helicase RecG, partial [Candidatus Gottesmanbacteria bacterium]|nr:DNA helicase RecG [Candidatus Gottesmanbacteria bacterium]